ncbi:MAG: PAS domain S-box protein, partial [Thermoleophilia bacterium]|nr:PAS domain S-box protein [Thermoleophilia bacterium]
KSQFLNNLLDGMAEGVYIYGENGAFEYINRAGTEITGFSQEEILGKTVLDLVAPEQVEAIKEMMMRRKAGDTDRYEVDIISKDGHKITLSQSVSPLFQNGAIVGAIGVATDVTEASKLHKDLKQQNRRLELLQSITEKSVSGLTSGKALKTLVHEVAETFSYDMCNIFMPAVDGSKLQIVASHGYPAEYVLELNNSDTFSIEYQKAKKTPLVLAFKAGRQSVMKDAVAESQENTLTESAMKHGFHSVVATPLNYRGERLGAIVVYTKDVRDFDQDELGLLSSIAAQASTIAGSAEIYDKLVLSEERYREIYNIAADWMYMLDSDGVITDCNQTMAQSLGIPRDSIIGSHIYDYEVEADREKAKAILARFSEKSKVGMIFSAERNFVSASGKRLIVELHARALPAPEDHGFHWSVIGRDITEKKEAEQRINLLAAAVENTHECVIISDLNGDIISINDAGATLFGYEAAAMTGMHMRELWSNRNPEGIKERIYGKTLDGDWEGQMWYRRADGSSFPVFASSAKVDDESGKPVALVGIARDVSTEQELTTEILRRNRELAVLNAVATSAASSFDLDKTLKNSLDSITDSMNYDGGIIFLVNAGSQLLSPAASTFEIPEEMMDYLRSIKVGQGHSGKIAELGSPIFVDDYRSSPYYLPEVPELIPIESLGGVPLISKDKILGVLIVSTATPHEFSDSEQTLLSAVGNSLGVAIESAQLFEDVARGRNEWESTFDAMTNGVSIHDRDFTIVRANRALARILGTTAEQLVGRKCYEVFHDRDLPLPVCPQAQAFKDGVSHTLVTEEAKIGAILHISVDPIFDQDGNIVGAVHDVRDITEQERLREQLTQSEKIRALGEMAGGVAHDFNNFLTVILGNTQLMLAQIDGDGQREFRESLESVQRAAADAAETVRRIQEFTRVRTTRSFTTVDLNRVVINAIEVARPRWRDEADARGVKIGIESGLSEIPPVHANESELSEVLINLVMNAADALPDGGTITVSTDVEPGGEWVRAVVADNGKGMDEEVSKRIFEPFFSTKGVGGSGLGLSVAYGIVNRHGGDIMVESREGEGTRFIVRLPVATVADLSAASKLADKVAAGQGSAPVRPAKILIIDDEPMIRTLLGDMVQKMGHKIEVAEAGEQGLADFDAAVASGEPFDLVLTDLGMPGMSGWEVVEAIKQRSPETPVVLITGWGDQLDSGKMRESGVDAVVAKPFRVEDIRRLLAKELA